MPGVSTAPYDCESRDRRRPLSGAAPAATGTRAVVGAYRGRIRASHFLASVFLLDILVGQVHSLHEVQFGPASLSQVYRAFTLLCISVFLIWKLRRFPSSYWFVIPPAAALIGSVLLSTACILAEGTLSLESVVAASQVLYWLVVWMAVFVVCSSARNCRIVLGGIVVAGIYAALSILYLYFARGKDASIYRDLVGNAAGYGTAKGLTGILATAGLAAVWLFRTRAKSFGILTLFICVAGILLTYQRAGLVGFTVAVLWLAVWCAFRSREGGRPTWALRPIAVVAILAGVGLATIGTRDLETRWHDISDSKKAGSGRIAFWKVALDHYGELDTTRRVSGIGYTGMTEALERKYGARIHTHSDLLDVLLMFGAAGLAALLAVHVAIVRMIRRYVWGSSAFAIAAAVYLVMFCQGALTGQILCPSVMSCYLAAITCICLHARHQMRSEIPDETSRACVEAETE